jgi:hypothetical protein
MLLLESLILLLLSYDLNPDCTFLKGKEALGEGMSLFTFEKGSYLGISSWMKGAVHSSNCGYWSCC